MELLFCPSNFAHLKVGLKNPLIKKAEAFLMNLSLNDEARVV